MIVLHARALLSLAVAEPRSDWLLTQLHHDEPAAPAHQPTWVLAALVRLAARGVLAPDDLGAAVTAVVTLPQRLEPPDERLVRRAQALTGLVGFLDGLHVALAERLEVPVLATDCALSRDDVRARLRCEIVTPPAWLYPERRDDP
ncbi:hypothetical protein [Jannaschia sp. R86511]|uniref:hypothetical protein n=1 Tax=Jannaschia sp. R86511 TaxID=3093853 RepID=UPI0036D2F30F